MKKVTILTSLFKAEQYLGGFLDDITQQTIFNDCELFLLNGNSPEDEESVVAPYLEKFDNIRYIRLTQDPGIYGCWNYMIKNSESEYITNANVDDKLFPECLEKHVNLLDSKTIIDVAYCANFISFSKDTDHTNINNIIPGSNLKVFPTEEYSFELLKKVNLPHNHPVWRRSLHDRFGYFEEEKYVSGSDWEFWLRCGSKGAKMELIKEVLGIYFQNPEGMSTKKENMNRNLEEVRMISYKYKDK